MVERPDGPLGVFPYEIVADVAGVESDHEDEREPADDGEKQDEDQPSTHLTLDLDVVLGGPAREMWRVREFPAGVQLTVRLLEDAAISLKDGASFRLGAVRYTPIAVPEEGLEHLVAEWEAGALLPQDVHVVVGHGHAVGDLLVGA